jgi:branched-chain amino acid transport system substrate-binding protein
MARHQPDNQRDITRRRVLATSAALGGVVFAPVPLRYALAQSKPYRIGTLQPLSGAAAIIAKTALVGVQMATDRINAAGGINGRKIELIVAD